MCFLGYACFLFCFVLFWFCFCFVLFYFLFSLVLFCFVFLFCFVCLFVCFCLVLLFRLFVLSAIKTNNVWVLYLVMTGLSLSLSFCSCNPGICWLCYGYLIKASTRVYTHHPNPQSLKHFTSIISKQMTS